jgi:hypothetical protein
MGWGVRRVQAWHVGDRVVSRTEGDAHRPALVRGAVATGGHAYLAGQEPTQLHLRTVLKVISCSAIARWDLGLGLWQRTSEGESRWPKWEVIFPGVFLVGALCDVFRVNAHTEISRMVHGPDPFTVSSLPAWAGPCNARQLKFENGLNSRFLKFGIYINSKFYANSKFCSI